MKVRAGMPGSTLPRRHVAGSLLAATALWAGLVVPMLVPSAAAAQSEPESGGFTRAEVDLAGATYDIRAIAHGEEGFVWIATSSGLIRWDGTYADLFSADPDSQLQLPQYVVSDVAPADSGVWVAAGSLVLVDPRSLTVQVTNVPATRLLRTGRHVIAAGPEGIFRYTPATEHIEQLTTEPIDSAGGFDAQLIEDSAGRIHIGTSWGVLTFDSDGVESRSVIPGGSRGLAARADGRGVWVTSPTALWTLAGSRAGQPERLGDLEALITPSARESAQSGAGAALVEHNRNLWIGLGTGDIAMVPVPGDAASASILSAAEHGWEDSRGHRLFAPAPDGTMWLATERGGLFSSGAPEAPLDVLRPPTGVLLANDLHFDGTWLWLASERSGLVAIDPTSTDWNQVASFDLATSDSPTSTVFDGVAGRDGGLWITADGRGADQRGFFAFDSSTAQFASLMGSEGKTSTALATSNAGGVVVALDGGNVRFHDSAGRLESELDWGSSRRPLNHVVYVIEQGRDGVWIGGANGLEFVDDELGTSLKWLGSDDLVGDEVFAIVEDAQGLIWLGTSAGIERLDPRSGQLDSFGSLAGLPPGRVAMLLPHPRRDALWAGTSTGLALFDLTQERSNLLVDPGLSGEFEFLAAETTDDGTSFIATTDGLLRVVPDFPALRTIDRQVQITELRADGNLVDPSELNEIDASTIEFRFGYPEFQQSDAVRFEYRVDDDSWVDLPQGRRDLLLTGLRPGDHELVIRALTADGVTTPRTLGFAVVDSAEKAIIQIFVVSAAIVVPGLFWAVRRGRRDGRRARELESVVAERTHELVAAAAAAGEANDSKSRFLAMISHELRTPLNAVVGFTDLVAEHSEDARTQRWASRAQTASKQLEGMVEELLVVARQGEFRVASMPTVVDLEALIESTVELVASTFEVSMASPAGAIRSGVDRSLSASGTYLLNEGRLRQVLINLLSNALQYADGERVEVRVEEPSEALLEPLGATSARLRFSVTDWGSGIAADDVEVLFQPFQRGSETGAGLGLGLTISRQLVHQMGSTLHVDTRVGGPTRFWFDVDAVRVSVASSDSDVNQRQRTNDSIVVVDDDPYCRELLVESLLSNGYQPVPATTGRDAVEICRQLEPALLITDHLMPDMSGAELAHAVQDVFPGRRLPVVCVTALPDDAREIAAYTRVLSKPYRVPDLISTVTELLDE